MSLKAFHIAFVAVTTVLFLFVAWYALTQMTGTARVIWAGGAVALAVVMLVYGRGFLARMRILKTE